MNIYQQRRIIAVSSMVVFGLGTISRLNKGAGWLDQDAARFYIGTGIAFTFVSVFTDLGLPIGAGFALLIMVAALINEGEDVFGFIQKRSRRTKGTEKRVRQARTARAGQLQHLDALANQLEPQTP